MNESEALVVLAFLAVVAGVYVAAADILIHMIFGWPRRRRGRRVSRRWRWWQRSVLTLAAIGILCMAYGYFIEPYWLEVTHVSLTSDKLPAGGRAIRLVHISDLHCEAAERLETRLVETIAKLQPDAIAFTGDAANSPQGMATFKRCMSQLAKIAPVFAADGNWDGLKDPCAGTGARSLHGEAAKLQLGGAEVWFAGAPDRDKGLIKKAIDSLPDEALSIFLYHSPVEIPNVAGPKVDLYLAGHTHGGQVAMPIYGALIAPSSTGKRYEAGLYRKSPTWLYVSRGIGLEGSFAPRVRFMARPEVTLIEISPQDRSEPAISADRDYEDTPE